MQFSGDGKLVITHRGICGSNGIRYRCYVWPVGSTGLLNSKFGSLGSLRPRRVQVIMGGLLWKVQHELSGSSQFLAHRTKTSRFQQVHEIIGFPQVVYRANIFCYYRDNLKYIKYIKHYN